MSNTVDTEIKTAIGCLLLGSDEPTKRVLTAFNPSAKRTQNSKALNGFNLDILEASAPFLGIELADSEDNKLFTKESLINRILLGINSFLPSQCTECLESYVTDHSAEEVPHFKCFFCFQGSHNCDAVKSKHEALKDVNLLSGHVWLCHECLKSSNPIKPRKSKTRHNSLTKPDSSLARIRQDQEGQPVISSPAINSPLTPLNGDDIEDSALSETNRAKLEKRLEALAKEKICPKYKVGKCIHGLRGNKVVNGEKCSFDHPKKCNRFCSFGNTNKGCKKGEQCEYFHPVLCKFSVQKRCCTNQECTYMHLKGTRRNSDNASNSKKEGKQPARQRRNTGRPSKDPPQEPSQHPPSSENNHFLELKKMVEAMQSNFMQEIALMKANLPIRSHPLQFNPPNMMHPSQASFPYPQSLQQQTTFIPQSLC